MKVSLGDSLDAGDCEDTRTMEFILNVLTEFAEFSDKIFVITVKGLEPLPNRHLLC